MMCQGSLPPERGHVGWCIPKAEHLGWKKSFMSMAMLCPDKLLPPPQQQQQQQLSQFQDMTASPQVIKFFCFRLYSPNYITGLFVLYWHIFSIHDPVLSLTHRVCGNKPFLWPPLPTPTPEDPPNNIFDQKYLNRCFKNHTEIFTTGKTFLPVAAFNALNIVFMF